ncbi:MAG: hypothetical protein JKX98_11265 [Alcanivoracaceae bacterium]|nr:hypothetical protein [Alcanivoracaceae bacterium]
MTGTSKFLLVTLFGIGILVVLFFLLLLIGNPMGGGPNPKAVLVVSSKKYELSQILNSIDLIENTLDKRINKKLETIKIGDSAIQRYSYYEAAYWYPKDSSDIYGVAIVKWDTKG